MTQIRVVRVAFRPKGDGPAPALLSFSDPEPVVAALVEPAPHLDAGSPPEAGIVVLSFGQGAPDAIDDAALQAQWNQWAHGTHGAPASPRLAARVGAVRILWSPGFAVLASPAASEHEALLGLVEFAFHADQVEQLEKAVADSWSVLSGDRRLIHAVEPTDLARDDSFGRRVQRTFLWREKVARIASAIAMPDERLGSTATRIARVLRRKYSLHRRLSALDEKVEVFEHVYEMASQRLGESRAAFNESRLEVVIIVLLAIEVVLCALALFQD